MNVTERIEKAVERCGEQTGCYGARILRAQRRDGRFIRGEYVLLHRDAEIGRTYQSALTDAVRLRNPGTVAEIEATIRARLGDRRQRDGRLVWTAYHLRNVEGF